jgi:hypothetical protein
MSAMKVNLMQRRRVLYDFFWRVVFLSRVSALASSFGADIKIAVASSEDRFAK